MTDKSARETIATYLSKKVFTNELCSDGDCADGDCQGHCAIYEIDGCGHADAMLAALEAGGFAVVPKEPTEEMFKAYYHAMDGTHPTATMNPKRALVQHHIKARKRWSAMLAAIPAPTLQPAGK